MPGMRIVQVLYQPTHCSWCSFSAALGHAGVSDVVGTPEVRRVPGVGVQQARIADELLHHARGKGAWRESARRAAPV